MHFIKNSKILCLVIVSLLFAFGGAAQVFPGDADNNGVVNNLDVLSIAYAFSTYGPARENVPDASTQNIELMWNDYFPSGLNYAFADCDGSGLVDYSDFLPVYLFYGIENASGSFEQAFYPGVETIDAPLFFERNSTAFLTEGSVVEIPLYLGDTNVSVESFTGIAFTIAYDSDLIRDVIFTFEEDTWINENVETINFLSPEIIDDKKEISIATLENVSVAGNGKIGTVSFIIIDNLTSFLSEPTDSTNTLISITNVKMTNSDFFSVPVAAKDLELMVYGPEAIPTAVHTAYLQKQLKVSPNPASDELNISAPMGIERVDVMNLSGEIIHTEKYNQEKNIVLKTRAQYPSGLYFIRIHTEKGMINKKVVFE